MARKRAAPDEDRGTTMVFSENMPWESLQVSHQPRTDSLCVPTENVIKNQNDSHHHRFHHPHSHSHHQQTNINDDDDHHLCHHHHHHHYHDHEHPHQSYPPSHQPHSKNPNTISNTTFSRRHASAGGLSQCVWTIAVTILLSLIFLSSHIQNGGGVAALSCATCDLELCPNTSECPGGLVIDICGCCQVCAKIENQTCGGHFGIRGQCDRNLHCFIQSEPGKPITGSEAGLCKAAKEFQCNGSDCPPVFEQLLCPRDSYLITMANEMIRLNNARRTTNNTRNNKNATTTVAASLSSSSFSSSSSATSSSTANGGESNGGGGETVPDRMSYCVCNSTACGSPICAPGFTPFITKNATGFPGSCCDVFTCNETKGCDPVICPPLDETPCPDDSVRLPNIWTEDNCCELQQGCSCPARDMCPPVKCPTGSKVRVIARATRSPGLCCDRFRCINESELICRYRGKEMKNGERWNIDKCHSCVCKDGLNRCRNKTCNKLSSCLWFVTPEDECCPICRGCVSDSGNLYNNSDVWKENDCTTCSCVEGQVQCQAESCAVHCTNPVRVPGQCCPICPEETTTSSTSLAPHVCPRLDSCSLECPQGLELSPHGCFVCKCKKEKCLLDCPYGLKSDFEGDTICECRGPEILCPPWNEDQCDKKCEYGYKRTRDGCIKCKCNRCPPPNCTKRCLHDLMFNDEGCRICKCKEELTPELSVHKAVTPESVDDLSCLSRYGVHHDNGESWNDGCRMCYCHKGVEMCSLIACRAPHCSNPVFRVGDCCPSCPGLTIPAPNGDKILCQSTYGEYYVEGQTWKMDPCTRCVCHGGTILCETLSCRPVLCHHPVKPENQCCPVCKGEDLGLLPVAPLHKRCRSPTTGMVFKHREVWRSSPCQTCVCQDGQFHCYNQMCAPVKCEKTLLRKDQCCPTCAEPETIEHKICSYNGEFYDLDEKWEGDNCTQCLCSAGRVHCFPLACPALHCSVMIKKRGQCCPVCYDMPSHGNDLREKHHNKTSDGDDSEGYSFNYVGYIILVIILLALAAAVAYLVYRLYFQRPNRSFQDTPSQDQHQTQKFISHKQPTNQDISIKQPDLEKLCYSSLADKGTGDRAYNTYSDLNFCDQNKNTPVF